MLGETWIADLARNLLTRQLDPREPKVGTHAALAPRKGSVMTAERGMRGAEQSTTLEFKP